METIEAINHESDQLLDFRFSNLLGDWSNTYRQLCEVDDNTTVHLTWRNATITTKAATARAWVELGQK